MKHTALLLLLLSSLIACKSAQVNVSPNLNAEPMSVKGKNTFKFKPVVRYGDFKTSKVKRGWTKGYSVPFILHFQGAKQKLSFTQYGPGDQSAKVSCVSKFKSTEIGAVGEFFGIPLKYENFFAGSIDIKNKIWDFILYNPDGDFLRPQSTAGFAQSGTQKIDIQAIRGLNGQPEWMKKLTVFGHEFVIDGKVVGAVSTLNNGTVWIDPTLDADTQLVLAALSTGIMLRTDVETAARQ